MKRPDVVVVGAGSAGCVTARRCAEMGLRTLLLERKPQENVGKKVCGDEVSKSHFEETGIDYPRGNEISAIISGADVYPPSLQNELKVRGWNEFDGWTVDRYYFGQRLLQEAIRAGATFQPNSHVMGPIMKQDQVVGVSFKENDKEQIVLSKLVVDASGFAGVIRNKIDSPLVEKNIGKEDVALCYREILELREPLKEPQVAQVFLGTRVAPNGYAWIFPKGKQRVNAGLGMTGGTGKVLPKNHFIEFKERYPLLHDAEVIEGARGAVPVRRPLKSLVADGVAFVGDAAFQVNPIHGGGVGPGIRAGTILGEVAKEAIARRNLTARGLWGYNTRYLSDFGKRLASLEVFRRFLQAVSDDDMDYGFEKQVLEAHDLMAANKGEGLSLSISDKLKRLGRCIGRLGLILRLQKAANLMKQVNRLYEHYPSFPSGLEDWDTRVRDVFDSCSFE